MGDPQELPPQDPGPASTADQPPPPTSPGVLDYSSQRPRHGPHPADFVTLRQLSGTEAELAAARLREEGIPAFVAGANAHTAHAFMFANVQLQVPAADLDRANALLDAVGPRHDPDSPRAASNDDDYVDEPWRCPSCHRKPVDQVPLTPTWRLIRRAFWFMLATPVVVGVLGNILTPGSTLHRSIGTLLDSLLLPWIIILAALAFAVVFHKRDRICRSCRHQWRPGKS